MTKKEFLKELEDRLQMLDEKERKDMIEEYSQHISLRMESGMKEEEAIDDFGDIDDLIAEILEAYHLNPEYEKKEKEKKEKASVADLLPKDFFSKRKEKEREKISRKSGQSEPDGVKRTPRFKKSQERKLSDVADKAAQKSGNVISWSWNKIKRILGVFVKVLLLFLALPAAFFDAAGLFILGTLLVMAFQGYPVIGCVIIAFGAILSMTAYILFLFTYIVRGGRKA